MELNLGRVKHIREPKSSSDVYIGRGSKWGNPFKIGVHGNREEVIAKYEEYLMNSNELLSSLNELKHKNLVCYCNPQSCHGDVLLKFATSA
jgi:hypothetical protein